MPNELIEAMSAPAFWAPHVPERVEVRQTHISWVFLAGPRVLKVKKPVRMAFLDYSSLEARRHWCEEEVRLNRRLAPTVYRGVAPIVRTPRGFALGAGGPIVEYAVEMRRLPAERMLDRLVGEGRVGPSEIRALAGRLADFHRRQPTGAAGAGSPDAVREAIETNLEEAEPFLGRTITARRHRALVDFVGEFVERCRSQLEHRVHEGRIRDGHGDLRAEHVCLEPDGISIFDCVEFSERLRTTDVASEIAFLAMDLEHLDAPELAEGLVAAYAEAAADAELPALVPFYAAHRACVRGKVESLRAAAPEVPGTERDAAEREARRFFALASRHAAPPIAAALVVLCGQVATGKSTLARLAADRTGFRLHSSDRVRKALAGLAPTERTSGETSARLYADEATERTYGELFRRAEADLVAGRGAILDATFAEPRWRERAREVAARAGRPFLLVACEADEATILERLAARAARGDDPSDATVEVYRARRDAFVRPDELAPGELFRADTTRGLLDPLDVLESRLASLAG